MFKKSTILLSKYNLLLFYDLKIESNENIYFITYYKRKKIPIQIIRKINDLIMELEYPPIILNIPWKHKVLFNIKLIIKTKFKLI